VSLYPPRLQLAIMTTFLRAYGTFHIEKLIEMFKVYKIIESPSSIRRSRSKVLRLQGSTLVTTGYRPRSEATALAKQLHRLSAVIIGPYRLLRRKL
jgi:hypothetical protein